MTAAEQYAKDVVEGRKVTGKFIKLAAERFLRDLEREDLVFDVKQANRAVNFIERKLRHWEGSWRGKPLKLEDWQKFIVQQIFGFFRNGLRLIRSVYIQIARKNGKTSFAAAILLYHLICGTENTPQILVGANNEDQAKICVNSAGRIIQQSPELRDLVEEGRLKLSIYGRNVISVTDNDRDGVIKAMSRNPETQDGFNPSLGIIDEYHEAKDDKLLNVIESGQGARPEPLLVVVTTAGFVKDGPCFSVLRKTSIDILEGKTDDDTHLAFIYEPDEGDDWQDEATWPKSNPNLGVSVFPEYLRSRLKKAKNEGGSKLVDFKTKNLNCWVDAPTVWIQDETWQGNTHGIKPEELIGAKCYGGLDLASGIDLNSFALIFPHFRVVDGKPIHPVRWWYWMPKAKVKTEKFDYSRWVDEGYILTTSGVYEDVIDQAQIIQDILAQLPHYYIDSVAYDPRLAYHGVIQGLGPSFGEELNPFGQGITNISTPTKEAEKLITNCQLEHFGNPVSRWMMANVVIRKDAVGNIMLDKDKSQFKIDGMAAMINAVAQWMFKEANGIQVETTFTTL